MYLKNIPYQSFCWVLGTTSFRTAKLNLKIEEQLNLLNEFYLNNTKIDEWNWNKDLQVKYYDFMKNKNFITGGAKRKDKDAREKTSGLVEIGLISKERIITQAGKELLKIINLGDFHSDNIFNIDGDSYVYLKQLLKTSIKVNDNFIRPLIIIIKLLEDLEYLTYDEFTYFAPLIQDSQSYIEIISNIKEYRNGEISLEDIIYRRLISMKNYDLARKEFFKNEVDKELITLIGMNRKSRSYDIPYLFLYQTLKEVFLEKSNSYENLLKSTNNIKHKTGVLWRNLIFKTPNVRVIRKKGSQSISEKCPFLKCRTEDELKVEFFKYLHVYKAMATLSDYFDLNRRYLKLTEILVFEEQKVKLDLIPRYFFSKIINALYLKAFEQDINLTNSVSLDRISEAFNIKPEEVYSLLSYETGVFIKNADEANKYIKSKRYKKFNELIDKKFTNKVLIELLECFEKRNDKRIEEIVTDEATVPTIFEYIIAIIWYKISERQGDVLDYMNLSLGADLLPKTHAVGGTADIVYKYDSCDYYPKHTLLIEVTLLDGINQRRNEMEPVSRHLGDHIIKSNNKFDYTLFISTYLDKNVVSDFRYRKIIPYVRNKERIDGMKIIPFDSGLLKGVLQNDTKYRELYPIFDRFYQMPLDTKDWYDKMVKEVKSEYEI